MQVVTSSVSSFGSIVLPKHSGAEDYRQKWLGVAKQSCKHGMLSHSDRLRLQGVLLGLTLSRRALQAFFSMAVCTREGLVTRRSSPTTCGRRRVQRESSMHSSAGSPPA